MMYIDFRCACSDLMSARIFTKVFKTLVRHGVLYHAISNINDYYISKNYIGINDKTLKKKLLALEGIDKEYVPYCLKMIDIIKEYTLNSRIEPICSSPEKKWVVSAEPLDLINIILDAASIGDTNKVIFNAGFLKALFMIDEDSLKEVEL